MKHRASQIALEALRDQLNAALTFDREDLIPMTEQEMRAFAVNHPGAMGVVGDFEIKCLHPEKYGLDQ